MSDLDAYVEPVIADQEVVSVEQEQGMEPDDQSEQELEPVEQEVRGSMHNQEETEAAQELDGMYYI